MAADLFRDAFILTGPTGAGKTALAVELALRLDAEIVAMDSMTLYRGMDVGTAKPTAAERRSVPHHLLDVLDPWESASVAWWLERARECCRAIRARGRRVLFVGGTPLYLKALLFGLFDGPPADEGLRQQLLAEAERTGPAALHARLAAVDPTAAARLHPNDVRRVVRALEVWQHTGRPISAWQREWERTPLALDHPPLWLDLPRAELYDRINRRVTDMVANGLVEEVRALQRLPIPLSREAGQALGYKEILAHLEGRTGWPETVAAIQTRTRNFAKRQITWFRHLPGLRSATRELTFTVWGLTIHA